MAHPKNSEPPNTASMRLPLDEIFPGSAVRLISGNQFQGGGAAGDQMQIGSALLFKKIGDCTWTSLPVAFVEDRNFNAAPA